MAGKPTRSKRRGPAGDVLPYGTAGARALTVDDCPEHLGDTARNKWAEIVAVQNADPAAPKLLLSDLDACVLYCQLWGYNVSAARMVTETTLALKGDDGAIAPNPYYPIVIQTGQQLRLLQVELGLTPASRPRVHRDKAAPPAVPPPSEPPAPAAPSKLSRLRLRFA